MGKALSPINHISKSQPPIYIVQGDNDALVHHSQATRFQAKSAAVGATCEVLIREGAGHGGWREMGEDSLRMLEWFDFHLLGKQPTRPFTNGVSRLPSTTQRKK